MKKKSPKKSVSWTKNFKSTYEESNRRRLGCCCWALEVLTHTTLPTVGDWKSIFFSSSTLSGQHQRESRRKEKEKKNETWLGGENPFFCRDVECERKSERWRVLEWGKTESGFSLFRYFSSAEYMYTLHRYSYVLQMKTERQKGVDEYEAGKRDDQGRKLEVSTYVYVRWTAIRNVNSS